MPMEHEDEGARALASVLRRLNVQRIDTLRFTAEAEGPGRPRLFGGMVAGQAAIAAARTCAGFRMHSLHAYFLLPGDPALAVDYEVSPLKHGKNFQACQVIGRQADRTIFSLQASFQRDGEGFAHTDAPPEAPPPETLPDISLPYWGGVGPIQLRDCDGGDLARAAVRGQRLIWMRASAPVPDDPELQLGLLVFASDMQLVRTGILQHPEFHVRRFGASLDHALWFHQPPRFDGWILQTMTSPVAQQGRPLIFGTMYRDGARILSSAQEGVFKPSPAAT